jgi:hypothetical protein
VQTRAAPSSTARWHHATTVSHVPATPEPVRDDYPLDDRGAVQVLQGGREAERELDPLLDGERALLEQAGERVALDELHHEHEAVDIVGHEVDDPRHVVAADSAEDVRLALEARDDLVVHRGGGEQRLDRDAQAGPDLLAEPDLAHTAGADLRLDPVSAGDDRSRGQVHRIAS